MWDRVRAMRPVLSEPEVVLPMGRLATMWLQLCPVEQCRLAQLLIERVVIADGGLEIVWRDQGCQGLRALDHPRHVTLALGALTHQQHVAALDGAAEMGDRHLVTAMNTPDIGQQALADVAAMDSQRWRVDGVKSGSDSTPMAHSSNNSECVPARTNMTALPSNR